MARRARTSIGPFRVICDGQHIGNLWQNITTRNWTAYSAIAKATVNGPAQKFTGTRSACRYWLETIYDNNKEQRP